jgi:hypothetical protein
LQAIKNSLKGVSYHNPGFGESLYQMCRKATTRHISGPDDILNQQIVYMINSEAQTPYAAKVRRKLVRGGTRHPTQLP